MKNGLKDYNLQELEKIITGLGYEKYRASQVYSWLYKSRASSFEGMKNLPPAMKEKLSKNYTVSSLKLIKESKSKDGTVKYLFDAQSGSKIESVLIHDGRRVTLCVSSQAGCACGCSFCATGRGGFKRDLGPGEITEQLIAALSLSGEKITNVVFMGMGEPLLNLENVIKSIEIISDKKGMNFSQTRITVSTIGITGGIRKIADADYKFGLAVSLICAENGKRSSIIPYNRKYPLKDIIEAVKYYNRKKKEKVTFEYVLIKGFNDSAEDAEKLSALLKKLKCIVNLIPYNSTGGRFEKTDKKTALAFQKILVNSGIKAFIRKEKGADIDAACGQLAEKAL